MESLGEFTIEGVLGEGGSAVVYAARRGDEVLALKVPRPEMELSEREVAAFVAEAQRAQRVSHPSLIAILGAGILPDGRPYLAMPRLRGEPLAQRIARGPMPLDTALRLFRGLAEALDALHGAGLVHRDIKPENVFVVGAEERLVLLDLGIARDIHAPASTTTQAGLVRGTPAYMAPERFFGARASTLTDTYEAAVVLYAMLAGRLPWDQGQEARGRMSPQDPRAFAPVPELVAEALLRALSVDETRRPQGPRALLVELEQAAISGADTTLFVPQAAAPEGQAGAAGADAAERAGGLGAAGTAGAAERADALGAGSAKVVAAVSVAPVAPTLPSPGGARSAGAAGDLVTQDTVALSTGRVPRRRASWALTAIGAVLLVGMGVAAGAFLTRSGARDGGDGAATAAAASGAPASPSAAARGAPASASASPGAGSTASSTASAAAAASASAAAASSASAAAASSASAAAASSAGAAAASSASAAASSAGAAASSAQDAPAASSGGHTLPASGAKASPHASAPPKAPAEAPTLKDCYALQSIYCGPDYRAMDAGVACRTTQQRNVASQIRPQEEWSAANASCRGEMSRAMMTISVFRRQQALDKH